MYVLSRNIGIFIDNLFIVSIVIVEDESVRFWIFDVADGEKIDVFQHAATAIPLISIKVNM